MKHLFITILTITLLFSCEQKKGKQTKKKTIGLENSIKNNENSIDNKAKSIIRESIEALGGKDAFYNLKGVSYDYNYSKANKKRVLKSHETYSFEEEKSHGIYTEHAGLETMGILEQAFNGKTTWVSASGKLVTDKKSNKSADFRRKTNYYWFTMFFKLLDKGIQYEYIGEDNMYDKVKISFDLNVGDAQDIYVLYINKKTHLVDKFLFTVMDFGIKNPKLMILSYTTVEGIKIPSNRKYINSNWEGEINGTNYTTAIWSNIKFGEQDDRLFEKPTFN